MEQDVNERRGGVGRMVIDHGKGRNDQRKGHFEAEKEGDSAKS